MFYEKSGQTTRVWPDLKRLLRQVRLQAGIEWRLLNQPGFRGIPDWRRPGTFLDSRWDVCRWFDTQCLGIVGGPARGWNFKYAHVINRMLRWFEIRIGPHGAQLCIAYRIGITCFPVEEFHRYCRDVPKQWSDPRPNREAH